MDKCVDFSVVDDELPGESFLLRYVESHMTADKLPYKLPVWGWCRDPALSGSPHKINLKFSDHNRKLLPARSGFEE